MRQLRQFAPIIAAAGILLTAPATAQEPEIVVTGQKIPPGYEPVKKVVKIGDLNLTTGAGVKEMEKRVRHAVATVCPVPAANSPSYESRDYKVCKKVAWTGARPQMDRAVQRATQTSSR